MSEENLIEILESNRNFALIKIIELREVLDYMDLDNDLDDLIAELEYQLEEIDTGVKSVMSALEEIHKEGIV